MHGNTPTPSKCSGGCWMTSPILSFTENKKNLEKKFNIAFPGNYLFKLYLFIKNFPYFCINYMETIQKISKTYTKEKLVNNYYSIISVLNDLKLTPMEINLLSFTAIRGGITNPAAKQEFCEKYDSNPGTIYNCISKLTRKGLFIKKGNKISIHPSLLLEFNNLTLNICMKINPVI